MNEAWRPAASLEMLRLRASCNRKIRDFFQHRNVLEVETPILSAAATTDPQIESFTTQYHGPGSCNGRNYYLITSPEFHMKRLLAAGSGPIYQLGRVFRQGEFGRLHNPEFTLLEWYRPGFSMHNLIVEVVALVRQLVTDNRVPDMESLSYAEVFKQHLQLDIHNTPTEKLAKTAVVNGIDVVGIEVDDRDAWLDLLMSHCIQPQLGQGRLSFITHYPASQAALAALDVDDTRFALRFELFWDGVELANGFQELLLADEQQKRFKLDLGTRQRTGKTLPPMDAHLLAALDHGLVPCSGVAIGVDRLLLQIIEQKNLDCVFTFPFDRA